jgi:hypothetical protein
MFRRNILWVENKINMYSCSVGTFCAMVTMSFTHEPFQWNEMLLKEICCLGYLFAFRRNILGHHNFNLIWRIKSTNRSYGTTINWVSFSTRKPFLRNENIFLIGKSFDWRKMFRRNILWVENKKGHANCTALILKFYTSQRMVEISILKTFEPLNF